MLTSGRIGRQSGILHRKDAAGHQVWTHLSWVRLMEPSLITQKTSSPPHTLTRLQSVAPGKVCRQQDRAVVTESGLLRSRDRYLKLATIEKNASARERFPSRYGPQ